MNLDTAALLTLSAVGAGTYSSGDLFNGEFRGGSFLANLSTVTSASVVITISGKDAASGQYYPILQSAAIIAAGQTILQIAPGLISSSNSSNAVLPKVYRISAVVTGASASVSGTIGGSLVQ